MLQVCIIIAMVDLPRVLVILPDFDYHVLLLKTIKLFGFSIT